MLTNSFVAGVLAASYVVVLFLQLNPALPLHPIAIGPLALRVGLFYAVTVSAIVYAVLLLRAAAENDAVIRCATRFTVVVRALIEMVGQIDAVEKAELGAVRRATRLTLKILDSPQALGAQAAAPRFIVVRMEIVALLNFEWLMPPAG